MDGFFDGTLLKLIIPIILLILFSLPDALRKRRKYPSNRKRKEQERQQQQGQEKQPELTAQTTEKPVEEDIPDIAKPRPETAPKSEVPTPLPAEEPEPEPIQEPVPTPVAAPAPPVPNVTVPPVAAMHRASVPHIVHGEPWGGLSGEARDIYAGLVWSELLEPPVALRHKRK